MRTIHNTGVVCCMVGFISVPLSNYVCVYVHVS